MSPADAGILQRLVLCVCGHGLDAHATGECRGTSKAACVCSRDAQGALDAAVDHARDEPWYLACDFRLGA